jgi:hypothetical protein
MGDGVGAGAGVVGHFTVTSPLSAPQGDTRVFLYELLPEAPFFLECNSFTSADPHKVSLHSPSAHPSANNWDHRASPPPCGHAEKFRSTWGSGVRMP